ncbi:ATP-binding domain-containing protein [Pseudomonas sp. FYR_11]|uniref:ATP-binding domain-containing protein n=1 Tax=Pseudomonas TaxID=286 RepID=UPI00370C770E
MSNSFFYTGIESTAENNKIIELIEQASKKLNAQIYLVRKQLGEDQEEYSYTKSLVILAPKHKIILVDYGNDEDSMAEFHEDFIEDLSALSHKYRYKKIIGRTRDWESLIVCESVDNEQLTLKQVLTMLENNSLEDAKDKKHAELLISLLIGSVNDIDRIKSGVPDNVLDKVKQKILLFDGDQTKFIYDTPDKKLIRIQGLSGTGKTELLLHKLKELYLATNGKIYFACHNKILAASLRNRIPEFFNFMKVEEQIEWNQRLWCTNAWGSRSDRNSGLYSYICRAYEIEFYSYGAVPNFEIACRFAIRDLKAKFGSKIEPILDYVLIDESQDFSLAFFELCTFITKNTVYVAGDIFQSIFDAARVEVAESDYLLSKCYRTDPRTLMAAHALGMGLFEETKLQWLDDQQWGICGYLVNKEPLHNGRIKKYRLTREPLSRFEDVDTSDSLKIVHTGNSVDEQVKGIIDALEIIKRENPTATEEDIGVIFLDSSRNFYRTVDVLQRKIYDHFSWNVNKAYDSKEKTNGELFVSNRNNVKGLEFPFVICVADVITKSLGLRNSLYMSMTRSFIQTYLLLDATQNSELLKQITPGIEAIKASGIMEVIEPSEEEKRQIQMTIAQSSKKRTFEQVFLEIYERLNISDEHKNTLMEMASTILKKQFKLLDEVEFEAKLSEFLTTNSDYF